MNFESFKQIRRSTLLLGILIAFLVVACLLSAAIYLFPSTFLAEKAGRIFPYPVASIGTSMITTTRLGADMDSIRQFYESQDFSKVGMRIDFSTEEGEKRLKLREKDLLNKLLEDRAIERLAKERGISITPDEATKGIEAKVEELGTGSTVEQNLARLYGWTLSDFGTKVVLPSLYEERLLEKYQSEDHGQNKAKTAIEAAATALSDGKKFPEVAQEFSEGQTAKDGGELGWFGVDDLAPDLQKPVEGAKRGVPTSVIESELGYHILLVEETKLENGKRLYHLRQIFTRKPSFADWLSDEMRDMSIRVYSREYEWNEETASIEFKDEKLRQFEKEILEKAEGDPSLLL